MLPRVWGFVQRVLAPPANAPVWTETNGEAPGSPEFDSMGRGQQALRNSNASIGTLRYSPLMIA